MKLLLHMCCAPCSVYPVSVLEEEGVSFDGLFYNPNIHPKEEFIKRLENVKQFAREKNIKVSYSEDFKQETWENFKDSDEKRCTMCYAMRLDQVARFAKENGYDAFTTTLLVSPYQKHEWIMELGEKAALKYGVKFYYRDFRPGFREGQNRAKEMGLYRQKFCGCIVSYQESKSRQKGK
ncbi:MAG: epoxyqueuosine reductase QueH [Clostridia bacterium]|nr:epoxyqueuosine reductase QueH [Clostridia bacterium]